MSEHILAPTQERDMLRCLAIYLRCEIHLRTIRSEPIYKLKGRAKDRLIKYLEHAGYSIRDIDLSTIEL